jgi:hypothetical protein
VGINEVASLVHPDLYCISEKADGIRQHIIVGSNGQLTMISPWLQSLSPTTLPWKIGSLLPNPPMFLLDAELVDVEGMGTKILLIFDILRQACVHQVGVSCNQYFCNLELTLCFPE